MCELGKSDYKHNAYQTRNEGISNMQFFTEARILNRQKRTFKMKERTNVYQEINDL